MSDRFFSVQVRVWPRLVWGIGAMFLAHHEFKHPADVIGGIVLTLIAVWAFASAIRVAYKIARVASWP
jgi:hypothetical protein